MVADLSLAARWFGEAARNGHVGAQVEYGILLFNGHGISKDEAAAADWFTRAALADNPVAQLRLARILADGRGAEANSAEAARWYLIAKARGLDDDYLESWLRRLDAQERDNAQKAADAWTGGRSRAAGRDFPPCRGRAGGQASRVAVYAAALRRRCAGETIGICVYGACCTALAFVRIHCRNTPERIVDTCKSSSGTTTSTRR